MSLLPNTQNLKTRQIAWLVSNRVLYWKLPSNAELRDFHEGMRLLENILQNNADKVHVILNARAINRLIGDMNTDLYPLVRRIAKHHHMGNFFVMTSSMMVKHHINRVTAPFGTNLSYSTNFRNVWESLRGRDTRIPSIAPKLPDFGTRKKPRRLN
ncbi:MAG: hypothetical protein AAFR81_15455 [Chloroflexota bacterium]